jgi:very-short-patch-repair endonuclease
MDSEKDHFLHFGSRAKTFGFAKDLRANLTEAESTLWNALRNRRLNGFKFRRQHPIKRFIADFYCHEARLVIEVDGEIHNDSYSQEYDEGRTFELKEFDVRVIRFTNQEILSSLDTVLFKINMEVQKSISLIK